MVPVNMKMYIVRLKLLVSRVRITFTAWGKKAVVVKMAAKGPKGKCSMGLNEQVTVSLTANIAERWYRFSRTCCTFRKSFTLLLWYFRRLLNGCDR